MKHDPSDSPVPLGLHLRMDGSRPRDDQFPGLCAAMFTLGIIGGVLRVPVFMLMLFVTPLARLNHGCEMGPIPFAWLVALIAMALIAVFGPIGNLTLIAGWRHALKLGCCVFAVSLLSFVCWFFTLTGLALELIDYEPAIGLALVAGLIGRVVFLIAYGVALRRYRDWEQWRWY